MCTKYEDMQIVYFSKECTGKTLVLFIWIQKNQETDKFLTLEVILNYFNIKNKIGYICAQKKCD